MAQKRRSIGESGFDIHFTHIDMLRIERLLKIAEGAHTLFSSEENEWLSNAQDLFAPELPTGEYPI